MIGRNDPCWCGSKFKWKKCHFPKESGKKVESEKNLAAEYRKKYQIVLKTDEQIKGIKTACHLTSSILDETAKLAKAGATTLELNDFAHKLHMEAGAIPASLNYGQPPFPKSICTSINDVICHGIPDKIPLKDGDIINIDVACQYKGYYGDCSRMVTIGKISEDSKKVVDVSYECLMNSIKILKPGVLVSDIGDTIERHAKANKCSVVNQFVAHGVGVDFHEFPQIPHCKNHIDIPLVAGMTFTIEPMINAGVTEAVIGTDQWTAKTKDGRPSAQWEHTILITEDGHEILTPWKRVLEKK